LLDSAIGQVLRANGHFGQGEDGPRFIDNDGLGSGGSLIDGKDAHARTLA